MDKKQLIKIICNKLNLKIISSNYLFYLLDCVLVGIEIAKRPGYGYYKLYFSIYPLWESTFKECMDHPSFLKCTVNNKNLDLNLPNEMTEEEINFAIEKCIEQFPFFPAQNIPFTKFADFLYNNTIEDPEISINFVDKLHIYKMIYNIALIRNKQEIALRIYNVISDNIWLWDDKIFKSWYGNKINYLRRLKDYESNRISLQNNININLAEPKIAKLPRMSFLE